MITGDEESAERVLKVLYDYEIEGVLGEAIKYLKGEISDDKLPMSARYLLLDTLSMMVEPKNVFPNP